MTLCNSTCDLMDTCNFEGPLPQNPRSFEVASRYAQLLSARQMVARVCAAPSDHCRECGGDQARRPFHLLGLLGFSKRTPPPLLVETACWWGCEFYHETCYKTLCFTVLSGKTGLRTR